MADESPNPAPDPVVETTPAETIDTSNLEAALEGAADSAETPLKAEPATEGAKPAETADETKSAGPTPEEVAAKLDDIAARLEAQALENEKLSARNEYLRHQRDRFAGRAGAPPRSDPAPVRAAPEEGNGEAPALPPAVQRMLERQEAEIASIRADRVEQAITQEVHAFRATFAPPTATDPNPLTEAEVAPFVQDLLQDEDYKESLAGGDTKLARSAMRALLKEAKAEAAIARHKAGLERKTQASTNLRQPKIAASAGGAPTPAAPATPRDVGKMSQDQIDAQLKSIARSGVLRR